MIRLRVINEDEGAVRAAEDKPCIPLELPGQPDLRLYAVLEVEISGNSLPYWQTWEEVRIKR